MNNGLEQLERIARQAHRFTTDADKESEPQDPFEIRNIHPSLPDHVRTLFDNGHFAQATFEAYKFLDNEVKRHSGINRTGKDLMMSAFGTASPPIKLSKLESISDKNEQEGYKFIFAGSMLAIRNPRGHEHSIKDDLEACLDHLALVSHLLRRLEQAGYKSLEEE